MSYNNTEYAKRAKANYRSKLLKQMSLTFSHHEQAIYDDLQMLAAHYGTASGAIKAAIVAHAKTLKEE
ncbi:hypothetical protein [Moraxella marmotae]|uniref:hypothetical protein n=1 Tax=Moraxella marmotae TaxID=3344520 RepID=UPI0035F3AAE4